MDEFIFNVTMDICDAEDCISCEDIRCILHPDEDEDEEEDDE